MIILLDTNIILRVGGAGRPASSVVTQAIARQVSVGHTLCVAQQTLTEVWASLTRPVAANGLGLDPAMVRKEVDDILASFTLLPDPPSLFPTWLDLCTTHQVRGRQVYDARIAAFMIAAGITHLITLNPVDFARYSILTLIVPGSTTPHA